MQGPPPPPVPPQLPAERKHFPAFAATQNPSRQTEQEVVIAALTRSSGLSRLVGAAQAAGRQCASAVPPITGSSVQRGRRGGLVGQIRAYVLLLREPMRAVTAGRSGTDLSRAVRRDDDVGERLPE